MAKKTGPETTQSSEHNSNESKSRHNCKDCEKKEIQIQELTDSLKRLQAEFENYQKRTTKENSDFKKFATEQFLVKLLPLIDSFEEGLKYINTNNNHDPKKVEEGLKYLHKQLWAILSNENVRKMESQGKKFEPDKHEVLMTEHTDDASKDHIILGELQPGYLWHNKVLRHAKVKIAVQNEEKENPPEQKQDQGKQDEQPK
jgi:molecular chaperone GrpE